jgi:hypothetical protein
MERICPPATTSQRKELLWLRTKTSRADQDSRAIRNQGRSPVSKSQASRSPVRADSKAADRKTRSRRTAN